jgi:D-xylose transport system substrate-binding protein
MGLIEERWQLDQDLFVARAQELGAEVSLQVTHFEEAARSIQEGDLAAQGIDVLVIISPNEGNGADVVKAAHQSGIPVVAYDRIINDCDLDFYVSFDNVKVGKLQADYLVKRVPRGNYLLIEGPSTDTNAQQFRQGQMAVLQPYIDRGDIRIVGEHWVKGWFPLEALMITRETLEMTGNQVDAVIASNDGTAGGVIRALVGKNLGGKVLVSGQDADLAACQRIVEGTQIMTVYKPVKWLANQAAEVAVALAKKQPLPGQIQKVHNGSKEVPSVLFSPLAIDLANLKATVISDGFHLESEIYKNPDL